MIKITTLLMAAGQSRRMGQNKLLLPVDGQSLLRRTAQTLLASGLKNLLIVTGHESARAHAALESLATSVEWVHNSNFETGLLSSLQAGVRACDDATDAVMIVLADQVHLNPKHLEQLVEFFATSPESLTAPMYGDERGHPVIIPRAFFAEILNRSETPEKGAQFLFKNHPDSIRVLNLPAGPESEDIDTPADYARAVTSVANFAGERSGPIDGENSLSATQAGTAADQEVNQLQKEINAQNQREVYS